MTNPTEDAVKAKERLERSMGIGPDYPTAVVGKADLRTIIADRDRLTAEVERLNAAVRYEQDRSDRIGTHGPGCEEWGPRHYECLLDIHRAGEAKLSALSEIVRGYRAATHWIGADSWDGCSDCMDILRAAAGADPDRAMMPDEIAMALRPLRSGAIAKRDADHAAALSTQAAAQEGEQDDGGQDRKFAFRNGQYVNRISGEPIPKDEPIIIFRARDRRLLPTLLHYLELCEDPHHRQAIKDRIGEVETFQVDHADRVKEPGITRHIRLNEAPEPFGLSQGSEAWPDKAPAQQEPRPVEGEWVLVPRCATAAMVDSVRGLLMYFNAMQGGKMTLGEHADAGGYPFGVILAIHERATNHFPKAEQADLIFRAMLAAAPPRTPSHPDTAGEVERDYSFDNWLQTLEEDVIQGEYGYEPGEFTVYPASWRKAFDDGLTPAAAFGRALDALGEERSAQERIDAINHQRIKAEDRAVVAESQLAALTALVAEKDAALDGFNLKAAWIINGTADSLTVRLPLAVIEQAAAARQKTVKP